MHFSEVSGHIFPARRRALRSGLVREISAAGWAPGAEEVGLAWTERGRPGASFFTKRTAEAWLRDVQDQARAGTLPEMVRTNATVADACSDGGGAVTLADPPICAIEYPVSMAKCARFLNSVIA
jgi:hypothetical protein